MRSALAAAGARVRDLGGSLEEHVLWRLADLLPAAREIVARPFERIAWPIEERLLWPLRERTAGWGAASRALGGGALVTAVAGAAALAVLIASGAEDGGEAAPAAAPVAAVSPAPQTEEAEPAGPALHGVPPKFGVGDGVGVATGGGDAAAVAADDAATAAVAGEDTAADGGEAAATSSSQKPVAAGPAAMKVARRFSEAFVFYEIGERSERALDVFAETATPQLATALAERPPRQPASAEVPKARVLNLVPGPRRGKAYTVSASLLRVGVTSELRLELARRRGAWVVTDVRG